MSKNIYNLFYNQAGLLVLKKKYRDKKSRFPDGCIDASKLPDDINWLNTNITKISIGEFYSKQYTKPNDKMVTIKVRDHKSWRYFAVSNIKNAPYNLLKIIVDEAEKYEQIYKRVLSELGDVGSLLSELN